MADRPGQHRVVPVPFPEGVASQDGKRGFVALRTGGILTLDLLSGADLWTSALPARPRLATGDRLVAEDSTRSRDNLLQLLVFRIESDGVINRELEPVTLPDWVAIGNPDQPFAYDVWVEHSKLVIAWRAESFYSGGAAPPAHIEARARRADRGVVHIDLDTGRIVTVADSASGSEASEQATATPAATEIHAATIARLVPPGGQSPCVVAGRLFYLRKGEPAELQLVCMDFHTGETKWTRSLPDRRAMRAPARRQ